MKAAPQKLQILLNDDKLESFCDALETTYLRIRLQAIAINRLGNSLKARCTFLQNIPSRPQRFRML
jgi:hypothetical protein